jgi:Zn-dependent membrane protease YugP
VVILGIILIIVGLLVASLKVLLWVGIVLLVVGLVVNAVPIGGRRRRVF